MGQMKRLYMDLQEAVITPEELEDLNFDLRDANDPEWWRQQDHDLDREEIEALEIQADIEAERMGGWL